MFKAHGQIDRALLGLIIFVLVVGLIILTSASGPVGYENYDGDSYYFIKHQLFNGVLPGVIIGALAIFISPSTYKKFAKIFFIISIGLLILVFIPGIGTDFGTFAHSWIVIGGFGFQPAEIVKLTILIYMCAWMSDNHGKLGNFQEGLVPFLLILGSVCALLILQPDVGGLSIIVATAIIVFFVAGGSIKHLVALSAFSAIAFWILIQSSPYRAARLTTFLHPELDPQGIGYQINQALLAIGSGGLFGRGYGHSLQKFQYLPEVIGDSIFAIMAEELGFIFSVLFILIFVIIILRVIKISRNTSERFVSYVLIGIVSWWAVQAFINIGAMVGILPITGVTLPFVSYGGTSMAITLISAGILLGYSRYAKH